MGQASIAALAGLALMLWAGAVVAADLERGEYLFRAAGCGGCHTDTASGAPLLGGGRAIDTPFGRFYGPNISPDTNHGIGAWAETDFIRALRFGTAPDGGNYYPVFPYPSFTGMTDRDLGDIWAYIHSLPPVARPSRRHEVRFPFAWRAALTIWKWLNFSPGPYRPDPVRSAAWNRGAYLVDAVVHCPECHTPRNMMGGLVRSRSLAGTKEGPNGKPVPNISPDPETGIGTWDAADLAFFLMTGLTPGGDAAGGLMAEVIKHSTSRLTDADRRAVAAYVLSLPPIRNLVTRPAAAGLD